MSEVEKVKSKPLLPSVARICYNIVRKTDGKVGRAYTTPLVPFRLEAEHFAPLSAFLEPEFLNRLYFNTLVTSTIRNEIMS